jgi:tetratricopeptide (TPR) repeat protein
MMWSAAVSCLLMLAAMNDAHQRGLDLYNQHKYADAIPALEQAAGTEDPHSAEYKDTVLLIGQSYFMLSQAPKAIPWLEKVTNLNEANYMLGYAYLQNGQQDQSETAFARLFGLKPGSAAAHLIAGQMMLKKEYEAQAVTELRKALTLDPKLPETHFLIAETEIYRGQLDEAIAELEQEIAIDPNFSMAWYRLGDAYTRQEKWDLAIPNLQRAVWLDPDFSGPFILLGKCYFKQKNFTNAEGILRRALILDPRNASATYLLGQTLIAMGKTAEGREMLEKWRTLTEGQKTLP